MLELAEIEAAARTIKDHIVATPMVHSPALSAKWDAHIDLKLENLQRTGSFKVRGATYKIISALRQGRINPAAGVVAASAGNHAQGVALAARQAGLPATIVMPVWASIGKQEATRSYGGKVIISGANIEDCLSEAKSIAARGAAFIHPYDDREIIAGQATIGLEIIKTRPDVDTILVPVGGGGLISGVASAVKALSPRVKVIGVEAAACPSAQAALRAGKCVPVEGGTSLADGINVKKIGQLPLEIMGKRVDEVVSVPEEHIAASIQILLERKRVLAEGAGAVPLAALISGAFRPEKGARIVLLISGGNVDSPLLGRIIQRGLIENGRIMRLRLILSDKPGSLARILNEIAALGANILHIHHERNAGAAAIDETIVGLELETRNHAHIQEITAVLRRVGYVLETSERPDE